MVKRVLENMTNNEVAQDTPFCNALLTANLQYPDEMKKIYDNMKIANLTPDIDTFHTLLRGYANAKNASVRVSQVLSEMRNFGIHHSPKTVNIVLTTLFKVLRMI